MVQMYSRPSCRHSYRGYFFWFSLLPVPNGWHLYVCRMRPLFVVVLDALVRSCSDVFKVLEEVRLRPRVASRMRRPLGQPAPGAAGKVDHNVSITSGYLPAQSDAKAPTTACLRRNMNRDTSKGRRVSRIFEGVRNSTLFDCNQQFCEIHLRLIDH